MKRQGLLRQKGETVKYARRTCHRESDLLKYVIVLIAIVFQSCPILDAGALARNSDLPKLEQTTLEEALSTRPNGQTRDSRLLASAGSEFELFRDAVDLVMEYYVEQISARDLFNMVTDKLVFIALPQCVEDFGKCSGDVEQCFIADVTRMATRCHLDVSRLLLSVLNISLQELDPNSCVMDAGLLKELEIGTSGRFGGVGMVVSARGADYVVVSPFAGSPAYKAGIKAGDTILEIDSQPLHGMPLLEVLRKVRGPAGSAMSVKVKDSRSGTVRQIRLHRRTIKIPPVRYLQLEHGIGYLRIVNFQKGTASEVYKALRHAFSPGAEGLAGLVLDLRDDPGGLFDEAIQVANLFKNSGIVTSVRGRHRGLNRDFTAGGHSILPRIPIVILINKGSASASEILAGALQGMPQTLVMGERSFGKASVQGVFMLNKGMAIRLTTAHYYTADGRDIDGKGLEPDVEIPDADDNFSDGKIDLLSSEQLRDDADIRAALAYLNSGARPIRSPFSSWY